MVVAVAVVALAAVAAVTPAANSHKIRADAVEVIVRVHIDHFVVKRLSVGD